tara:strand:- start:5216 stop:5773 length:558 start_codon:yes stop_codon:yes gene_type:complete
MLSFKDDIVFHNIRTTSMGGKSINLTRKDNSKIQFISKSFAYNIDNDKMCIPKGLSHEEIYATIKEYIVKHSEVIYGKKLSGDVIDGLYNEHEQSDLIAKFPIVDKNGRKEFDGIIFDNAKKHVPLCNLKEKCKIQVVVELVGIYFVPKRFGLSWKVVQVLTKPNVDLTKYAFRDLEYFEDAIPV